MRCGITGAAITPRVRVNTFTYIYTVEARGTSWAAVATQPASLANMNCPIVNSALRLDRSIVPMRSIITTLSEGVVFSIGRVIV